MTSVFSFILNPITADEFLASHYQKRALHISNQRDKFSGLFSVEDLNDILNSSPQPHPGVRLSQDAKQFRPKDGADLLKAVQGGATLILENIDRYSLALGAFLNDLSGEIGEVTRFNLYFSQPDNQAFQMHYDKQDSFILQMSGYKEWWIFPATSPSFLPFQTAKEAQPPSSESCYLHCQLGPGDVLYVPQGHWHYAIARREPSMHLTLAMFVKTGIDFMKWLVDELSDQEGFRRALPLILSSATGSRDPKAVEEFERIKTLLVEVLNQPELYARFLAYRSTATSNRHPFALRGQVVNPPDDVEHIDKAYKAITSAGTASRVFLRQAFVVDLPATDGAETLWGANEVFTGFRDPDLVEWNLDLPGKATPETSVVGSEILEDGTFAEIVGSLGNDLNALRLSQAQIKLFAKLHDDKLYPERLATFALFTREDEPVNENQTNLFVASVGVRDLKLLVVVRKFSRDYVFDARGRPRIVTQRQ